MSTKYTYINHQSSVPIQKMSGIMAENKVRLSVKDEARDRIQKLDTHTVWSATLYFSARSALKNGISVLSGIGYYYALFHCIFAMTCLNFDISDEQLRMVSHDQLTNFLKAHVRSNVASPKLLFLFTDARSVREFTNYLSGESGHDKFMSLRHRPMSLMTDSFGKIEFCEFVKKLDSAVAKTIREFFLLLKNIEIHFSRYIFPVLSRVSDFDYYGEDFLENFFPSESEITAEIENFLSAWDNSR